MSGTAQGAKKASATIRAKYGQNFYKEIASKGESVTGIPKGFGKEDRTLLERILNKPRHHAQKSGRKGGYISKRGKK